MADIKKLANKIRSKLKSECPMRFSAQAKLAAPQSSVADLERQISKNVNLWRCLDGHSLVLDSG